MSVDVFTTRGESRAKRIQGCGFGVRFLNHGDELVVARGDNFLDVVVDSDDGSSPKEKLRKAIKVPRMEVGVPMCPQGGVDILLQSLSIELLYYTTDLEIVHLPTPLWPVLEVPKHVLERRDDAISQPQEGGNRARVSVLCPRYRELSDETHHDGETYWTPEGHARAIHRRTPFKPSKVERAGAPHIFQRSPSGELVVAAPCATKKAQMDLEDVLSY
jgi:hypothetical protein